MNIGSIINNALYNSGVKSTSKKSSSKTRMDVDEVLTVENINKMKQLAYRDGVRGERSQEKIMFMHQCRKKVAPDRKKLFAEAEAKASSNVKKLRYERPHEDWEYLLGIVDKLDEGSVKGQYWSDGYACMDVFDEKGELCGRFASQGGWHIEYTSAEQTVMNVLTSVYHETFLETYREFHGKNGNSASHYGSKLDVKI
ncbi:MAG: hypothetical protein J1E40_08385 [Oscillospiraceae bacterium]|nr:hypothetical protein [Oscillospiraceae bacterium]